VENGGSEHKPFYPPAYPQKKDGEQSKIAKVDTLKDEHVFQSQLKQPLK
jgi:hypothetical protein